MENGRRLVVLASLLAAAALALAQDPDITFNQLGPGLSRFTNGLDTTLDVNTIAIAAVGQNTFGGMQDMSLARLRMPITVGVPPVEECTAATLGEVRFHVQTTVVMYVCMEKTPGVEQWQAHLPVSFSGLAS